MGKLLFDLIASIKNSYFSNDCRQIKIVALVLCSTLFLNAGAQALTLGYDNSKTKWSQVNIYTFDGADVKPEAAGGFPGSIMSRPADANGLWTYVVDEKYLRNGTVKVIFNNAFGNQTADLSVSQSANYVDGSWVPVTTAGEEGWLFRGAPNSWGKTAMRKTGNLFVTCQKFAGSDSAFKISNANKADWQEAYPAQNYFVSQNSSYDITFDSATHAITTTKRGTECGNITGETQALTLGYDNSETKWPQVNIYIFDGADFKPEPAGIFPGSIMNRSADTNGLWTYVVDAKYLRNGAVKVIFNNAAGNQTADLPISQSANYSGSSWVPVTNTEEGWVFRGTPNSWEKTAMSKAGNVFVTCQKFIGNDSAFKISNANKADWQESYPMQNYFIGDNFSYDITFDATTHAITATKRASECGALTSSSSQAATSIKSASSQSSIAICSVISSSAASIASSSSKSSSPVASSAMSSSASSVLVSSKSSAVASSVMNSSVASVLSRSSKSSSPVASSAMSSSASSVLVSSKSSAVASSVMNSSVASIASSSSKNSSSVASSAMSSSASSVLVSSKSSAVASSVMNSSVASIASSSSKSSSPVVSSVMSSSTSSSKSSATVSSVVSSSAVSVLSSSSKSSSSVASSVLSSSASSVIASSSSSVASSSAASDPFVSARAQYATQCVACHGANGAGGFGGVLNTLNTSGKYTLATLATKISTTMPYGNVGQCSGTTPGTCGYDIANMIMSNKWIADVSSTTSSQ